MKEHSLEENILKDSTDSSEQESRVKFSAIPTVELETLANNLSVLHLAVDHNAPVSIEKIKELKSSIKGVTIDIFGREMTIEEIEKDPSLVKNIRIWREIENGNFRNISDLTFLPDNIGKILSKQKIEISLTNLRELTDIAAEYLSEHSGSLRLSKIEKLSDEAIALLSKHHGPLFLGVSTLSDQAARALCDHDGTGLIFDKITFLSNEAAKILSQYKGNIYGNKYIGDMIAKFKY